MSAEEILESNKLVATYIGYVYHPHPDSFSLPGWKFPTGKPIIGKSLYSGKVGKRPYLCRTTKDINFHSSWDWLMPVVEKIESDNMMATVIIICGKCQITVFDFESVPKFAKTIEANDKLKATWLCVVDFIKWFNLQNVSNK